MPVTSRCRFSATSAVRPRRSASGIARRSGATRRSLRETPAHNLPAETRPRLLEAARKLGEAVGYRSACTVEFIYDRTRDAFYFLEVNSHLQVDHPVTESVLMSI